MALFHYINHFHSLYQLITAYSLNYFSLFFRQMKYLRCGIQVNITAAPALHTAREETGTNPMPIVFVWLLVSEQMRNSITDKEHA